MAFESYYWKKNIKRDITYINKKMRIKTSSFSSEKLDEHISRVEIKLFLMAFSIRKLLDTKRLPDSVSTMKLRVMKFPRNSRRRGVFSDFEKLYDLDNGTTGDIEVRFALNQFIHAYFFNVMSNRNGKLRYIYATSDNEMRNYIYLIELTRFIKLMSRIAKKQVKSISSHYEESTGRIVTIVK